MDVIGAIRPSLGDASVAVLDEIAEVKGGAVAGAGPLGEGWGEAQEENGKEEQFFHKINILDKDRENEEFGMRNAELRGRRFQRRQSGRTAARRPRPARPQQSL